MLALFLLLTGLPWAFVWGNYLAKVRMLAHNAIIPTAQRWLGLQPVSG